MTTPPAPHDRLQERSEPHSEIPSAAGITTLTRAFIVVMATLTLGSLFNAQSLSDSAHQRPPGWERDLAVAITDPVLDVSQALRLDRPAAWIDDIRNDDDAPVGPSSGPPTMFVPGPDRPARLWITGDSLTNTLGPAVVRASADTDVIDPRDEVVYSSGLTRPDFFSWPDHLARGLAEEPTEIVVFMVGANDGQPILSPDGWVGTDTEAWELEYTERVAETMDVLVERATTSYWIGQPISRSADHAEKIAVMNAIFEAEASRRPTVRYVDSWDLFADERGEYSAYLPDASGTQELVRDDDGVHLNPAGADRLARAILDAVRLDWEITG